MRMSQVPFKQGAEGRLWLGEYNGEKCIIKERFPKKYRHPELDAQITRQRMKAETKAAARCQAAGILAPRILHMDLNERKIYMEHFSEAVTAKDYIKRIVAERKAETARPLLETLAARIGTIIGKMHANNIIHGDMTSSNVLVNPKDELYTDYDIVFIDFGLSHYNQGAEDKAVDLYVLERALLSTHSEETYLFECILEAYRKEYAADEKLVIAKFEEVRARGRKRTMIG